MFQIPFIIFVTAFSEYAVKAIRARDQELIDNMLTEFKHIKDLNHDNIIKVNEIY